MKNLSILKATCIAVCCFVLPQVSADTHDGVALAADRVCDGAGLEEAPLGLRPSICATREGSLSPPSQARRPIPEVDATPISHAGTGPDLPHAATCPCVEFWAAANEAGVRFPQDFVAPYKEPHLRNVPLGSCTALYTRVSADAEVILYATIHPALNKVYCGIIATPPSYGIADEAVVAAPQGGAAAIQACDAYVIQVTDGAASLCPPDE